MPAATDDLLVILVAAALLALVVTGVAGLVALGAWESKMAEHAPRRGALLLLADEVLADRRAAGAGRTPGSSSGTLRRARALRVAIAHRASLAQG